jgi:N-methylhydantoinase A
VKKPKYYRLATQLTLGIELSLFGEICFTKVEEGFEPGPMFWGRSQKPLLVDILLMEHLSTGSILEKFAPFKQGSAKNIAQRIQNSINVLTKNIKTQDPIEPEEFASILAEKFFSHLSVEIILNATSDQLILTGPLAPYLIKQLRAHLPLMKISLDPQAAHSESQSVLEWAKDHPMSQTTQHQEL